MQFKPDIWYKAFCARVMNTTGQEKLLRVSVYFTGPGVGHSNGGKLSGVICLKNAV